MKQTDIKQIVNDFYSHLAAQPTAGGCGCSRAQIATNLGYSSQEIQSAAAANLGLGCGNPTALGEIKAGDTVLDLGAGAGFDCFLAAQKVGATGRVIGVDMSTNMVERARANAAHYEYRNVEFRLGDIERLPVEDNSIDIIISNCVINLAPDKLAVFKEARRVLKEGGKMYVSDIVLLEELSDEQRRDPQLLAGCVGGAVLKDDYLKIIEHAGLKVRILAEDKDISKQQYQGIPLESLKIEVQK